jgi:hypothetical protein
LVIRRNKMGAFARSFERSFSPSFQRGIEMGSEESRMKTKLRLAEESEARQEKRQLERHKKSQTAILKGNLNDYLETGGSLEEYHRVRAEYGHTLEDVAKDAERKSQELSQRGINYEPTSEEKIAINTTANKEIIPLTREELIQRKLNEGLSRSQAVSEATAEIEDRKRTQLHEQQLQQNELSLRQGERIDSLEQREELKEFTSQAKEELPSKSKIFRPTSTQQTEYGLIRSLYAQIPGYSHLLAGIDKLTPKKHTRDDEQYYARIIRERGVGEDSRDYSKFLDKDGKIKQERFNMFRMGFNMGESEALKALGITKKDIISTKRKIQTIFGER